MVQPPTAVHKVLVRLLQELEAEGEAEAGAHGQEEAKIDVEQRMGAVSSSSSPSSLPLTRRVLALFSALLELEPPPTPPRRISDDQGDDEEDDDDTADRSYPSYYSDEEDETAGLNFADVLAKVGLSQRVLRLLERHPHDAALHRLGARVLVWLHLMTEEVCPSCIWNGCPDDHEAGIVHTCGVLAAAVAAFRDDPATLNPVLAALAGAVRGDPEAAVAVLDGKGALREVVALLGRFPPGAEHGTLVVNAIALFFALAHRPAGAAAVGEAGGAEALVGLLRNHPIDEALHARGWGVLLALLHHDSAGSTVISRLLAAGALPLLQAVEQRAVEEYARLSTNERLGPPCSSPSGLACASDPACWRQAARRRGTCDKIKRLLALCRARLEEAARAGERWVGYGEEEAEWLCSLFALGDLEGPIGSGSRRRIGAAGGGWYGDEEEDDEYGDNGEYGAPLSPMEVGVRLNPDSSPFLICVALPDRDEFEH